MSNACPISHKSDCITLAHEGGGLLADSLLHDIFLPAFNQGLNHDYHDGAILDKYPGHQVMSTDTFVVKPLTFPGGDIGKLAVFGTTNDLLMCGATPKYLSCGFILGEGLPLTLLKEITQSMADAAKQCRVHIVTGDTKVIQSFDEPELMINTTGIGFVEAQPWLPRHIEVDDAIIINGDIARHGLAILNAREDLGFSPPLVSDCASLLESVEAIKQYPIHCMRDLTRGGLAASLIELSTASQLGFCIDESAIEVSAPVKSACELLGLNPFYMACEGRCIIFAPRKNAEEIVRVLNSFEMNNAQMIGYVVEQPKQVILQTQYGIERRLVKLASEQLPRIC